MLADFTIHIHDCRKPMAVRVKVHESVAALRQAAKRYSKSTARKRDFEKIDRDLADTLGICHRMHWDGDPVVAIVRLAPPHVGAGMVAHELCHAAVWLWEIEHKFEDVPIVCQNDEWFCWVLGELVRQTTNKFIEHGVYETSPENVM